MQFPQIPESLAALSDDEIVELETELVTAFNDATAEGAEITDEVVAELATVTESVEKLRTEQAARAEALAIAQAEAEAAESARQETLADLASRVNAAVDAEEVEAEAEVEVEAEVPAEEETPVEPEVETPAEVQAEAPVAVAAAAKPKAVTAATTVAQLKRNAPIKTRPRPEVPESTVTITAAVDVPGMAPGQKLNDLRQVAEAMCERFRTIGTGNGDAVQVARFTNNYSENRRLTRDMSPEQIQSRLDSFDKTPQGITAAGGLCAPVNNYYEQMVIADAARPVKDALASFQADRGGIRYNAPPTLASVTGGVARITAAQDLAGSPTKTAFAVTCPGITEVDIASIYTSLLFGNIGARAYPEYVEAWIKLGLAKAARTAETALLDGISSASTQVTTAGLVGAGRELFARLGQVAAGYRSRHRTKDIPLRVLLPAWSLDLVQTDFARTFTDETGLIGLSDADITSLFGVRDLSVSWYLDSKTGGGQVFGAAAGGQTYTDGTTATNTTVTSATAAFTAADVGKTITGAGIPAGTTITVIGSATSVTVSQATTATATGVSITIGRTTAAQYPTTVDAFIFPEGSFLHLDAGTLDLGLVRDSTLNSTNQFQMFSETFENVALVGPESVEVVLSLSPDGSYAAAKSVTSPINT
jgi:hypothetical protein